MHIVERHYVYEVCNKSFRQQSNLKIHQRIRSNELVVFLILKSPFTIEFL